jgi:hypothetical protein
MQRYFFHVRLFSGELVLDFEGTELPGLDAACDVAKTDARALIAEHVKRGTTIRQRDIEIADEHYHLLACINFRQVVSALFPR